jgi:hypothetical protein
LPPTNHGVAVASPIVPPPLPPTNHGVTMQG